MDCGKCQRRRRSGRHIDGRATILLQCLASPRRREIDADVWEQSRSCLPDDGYVMTHGVEGKRRQYWFGDRRSSYCIRCATL